MTRPRPLLRPFLLLLVAAVLAPPAVAQVTAPNYEEFRLDALFPAGGRQGDTVAVELFGSGNCNLSDPRGLLLDGPPGITVGKLTGVSPRSVKATLAIAKDAPPGRRCLRVLSGRSGLTNMLYFTVGRLPEVLEVEPNPQPQPQTVTLPVIVNGRVDPKVDVDCYRFALKKGQRCVAAVLAHAIDSHGQGKDYGFADAHLELADERGRVVAEAGDTLGLDPVIEYVAPEDGQFTARVYLESYSGFPQAVYRLVMGDVALPTSVFPPGGQRGTTVNVALAGFNVPPNTRQMVAVAKDDPFPTQPVLVHGLPSADLELPFVRGTYPEIIEAEPNGQAGEATALTVPMTANGRIVEPGDADWYKLRLTKGQAVVLETTAQRFLRSPIDTLVEVYDAGGKKLAENDDGIPLDYISTHDFRVMDSRLPFTAAADGDYFVRVSDQSGAGGPRAVYRLTVKPLEPDFELYQYPDGVPVWGPGTTAALIVKVVRHEWAGDVALAVDGLPAGWTGSRTVNCSTGSQPSQYPSLYSLLTITAPADVAVGTVVPFRIVGRVANSGRTVEHVAHPLTWYYTSDTGFFRLTPVARIAVAARQAPWLSTSVTEVSGKAGEVVAIPIQVHDGATLDRIDLTADVAGNGVATATAAPQSVSLQAGKGTFRLVLNEPLRPGRYGITISVRWRSDIRVGMPGPCTPLMQLTVLPASAPGK